MFDTKITFIAKNAPHKPGCYVYRDQNKKVLYVGKAKDLFNRLNQYFNQFETQPAKIQRMLSEAASLEFFELPNEIDALIFESTLIKKYSPFYNSMLKDDKQYAWIKIDKKEDFPKIEFTRQKEKNAYLYGPFPSKYTVSRLLRKLREIYPYRDCNRKIVEKNGEIKSSDPVPCLYYHIGLCHAPCAGFVKSKDYKVNIKQIQNILEGKISLLLKKLNAEMIKLSESQRYEEAALLRDRIRQFEYISQNILVDFGVDEEKLLEIKKEKQSKALEKLINHLNFENLKNKPGFKIECFDISNIQGRDAVASMIVFVDGKRTKALYRKFKIRIKDTPDDFAMMQEVLERRLGRLFTDDKSFATLPDLMIIDGGKGQLSSAFEILKSKGIDIPVIGLAKQEEEIFKIKLNENNKIRFSRIFLARKSEELYLIQRIRDEAHRFAITYHRKLRSQTSIMTSLDSIPGIGPKTKVKLLKKFGSWAGIQKASIEELREVIKNSKVVNEILKSK